MSSLKQVKALHIFNAFSGTDNSVDEQINTSTAKSPRLLEQVREAIRRKHYSPRTEEVYVHWIKRFIYFHDKRHPLRMGEVEVTAFLNYLARDREVAASTQNQALSAILFLYKETLGQPPMLPASVIEPLKAHLERARALHERDVAAGYGDVELPDALSRKYPRAPYEWGWKYVFPSHKLSTDPGSGVTSPLDRLDAA